jgi:hypothetical protein
MEKKSMSGQMSKNAVRERAVTDVGSKGKS